MLGLRSHVRSPDFSFIPQDILGGRAKTHSHNEIVREVFRYGMGEDEFGVGGEESLQGFSFLLLLW